jgi:DNA-binding Lrp family transcriptional regulator
MRELDKNEKIIVKELVKNSRISDNQIAKNTGLAVKSVNRKRKKLEEDNILFYFTHADNSLNGTGSFSAIQLYILDFKQGITRAKFIEKFTNTDFPTTLQKHCLNSYLAESNGVLKLVLFIESYMDSDILEIFNADYLPKLELLFGKRCITNTSTLTINSTLQLCHNYFPSINMNNGKIKENWSKIFIE